jgi:hydroxyacylglutathione hydrolase
MRVLPYAPVLLLLLGCSTASSDGSADNASALSVDIYEEVGTGTVPGTDLPDQWPAHGAPGCSGNPTFEPTMFTFKYDENTFIIRENKCLNYEGNFLYVLFGKDKVLLQDTGSTPGMSAAQFSAAFPLRSTVEGLITQWLAAHPNTDGTPRTRESIELLVTHSHGHGDHKSGDYQFRQSDGTPYPHTQIAGTTQPAVAAFFGLTNWPNQSAKLDLGGRELEILPIPGHEPSHVAVYDHGAQLLLTGDTLYPGHLFVADRTSYRASVARLAGWIHEKDTKGVLLRPIVYVLGNHIEKPPEAGKFYPYGTRVHNPERKLELYVSDVDYLASRMAAGSFGLTANFSIE